jgi:competence protein ComEC
VGKGNCTIIEFPERLAIIDIDNSKVEGDRTLTDPVAYMQKSFEGKSIFRFILTHPDMDHLSGLNELADKFSIINFWDTNHDKTIEDEDWDNCPYNKEDWDKYLDFRKREENPKCLILHRGDTGDYWTQDKMEILSPSTELERIANEKADYNHLSYVLMVKYAGVKILLGGDATKEAWEEILKECGADNLKADIFLAPHHGSENNIHEEAFEAIAPDHVIVSVAEGVEYAREYYKKLAKDMVLSTKFYGTMVVTVNDGGKYLPISVEKNGDKVQD